MSDQTPSVSWRLNDLLQAGKKAKAFAAASWQPPVEASESSSFTHWEPIVLDTVPEGAIEPGPLDDEVEQEAQEQEAPTEPDAAELQEAEAQQQIMVAQAVAEQAKRDAFEEGYERGEEQGTQDSEAKWAQARQAFTELTQSIRTAQNDMTEFYAPLKKLALHLAEQLVRGELTLSSAAIERLTKEALQDVEQQGEGPIIIRLHPLDMEKFSAQLDGELDGLDLRGDPDLSQGSVKVSIDDSAIEDLIEHRLAHLSEKLLGFASGQRESSSGSAFDSNFASPVVEKVIDIDEPDRSQENIVAPDQTAPQSPADSSLDDGVDDGIVDSIDNSAQDNPADSSTDSEPDQSDA